MDARLQHQSAPGDKSSAIALQATQDTSVLDWPNVHAPDARTGWWTEDGADSAIVVEGLGERVAAALLAPDGWSFLSASRRAGHSFVGDWLRFTGGQTITGVYRAPAAPEALGEARLFWVDQRCLVAHLPDGRRRFYSPLAFA